jgi:hypothetical protein
MKNWEDKWNDLLVESNDEVITEGEDLGSVVAGKCKQLAMDIKKSGLDKDVVKNFIDQLLDISHTVNRGS